VTSTPGSRTRGRPKTTRMVVRVGHFKQVMKMDTGFQNAWTPSYTVCVWTAKCTNDWVLDKAGVSRYLLELVKARKLAYFGLGHIVRKKSESLEKQIMQGTTPGISHKRQTENNTDGQHSSVDWIHIGQDTHVF